VGRKTCSFQRRPPRLRHNEGVTHPENLPQDAPLDPTWLSDVVRRSLDEDLGGCPGRDVTTFATIAADAVVTGRLVMRQHGVVAGLAIAREVVSQVAARFELPPPQVTHDVSDGTRVEPGTELARIEGVGHVVLVAERTILNLMSRACGVATHTRRWADALAGTEARVLDTRKTTPTLRELDKYAVRCGGGTNKRFGLYDVAMIKDNHIAAAGSVSGAISAIREHFPDVPIQVEVESKEQAFDALDAGVDFLMIDNMAPDAMAELVVAIRAAQSRYGRVWIEATGGLTVDSVREVAAAGVDFMSVGALTHSSPIIDIGLDLA
jgi:nicotinate-nucleotide pyrophosphorylase (carboxylating)